MHMLFAMFVLALIAGLSIVAFCVFLLVSLFRFVGRTIFGGGAGTKKLAGDSLARCERQRCFASNPPFARYCRRCGADLRATQAISMRGRPWETQRGRASRAVA